MSNETKPEHTATVDETVALIRRHCQPLETERVALGLAQGRVLREPVCADADQPPFDRSSMDGYAIRMGDPATTFRIVDRVRAGDWKPRELRAGEAVQIATGAALPGDGLQVVMKEQVRVEADCVTVLERTDDRNIRFKGEDARAGAVLVEPGTALGPGVLALMASVGCAKPTVTRLPQVLHLATGNEIVSPDLQPEPGQIRDSNSTLVHAFFHQFNIKIDQRRIGEDRAAVHSALRVPSSALDQVDLLLISGGASVAEHDFTRELLEELGYTLRVHRTTTRPGKPMIFGSRGNAVAFGLPGNPLAHFVCLNLYVRQALFRFAGATAVPNFSQGVLQEEFAAEPSPRETLWPSRMEIVEGEARLVLLRWQSSGDLTSMARANALVRISPNQAPLSRGLRLPFLAT